jgi:hypothetical protein
MRSSLVAIGLVLRFGQLGGCGFSASVAQGNGGGGGDGSPGDDACVTFASQVDTCRLGFDGDLTLSGMSTYDTGTHELRVNEVVMSVAHLTFTARAGDIDAILAHNVRLTAGAGLRAVGTLPFAIIVSGSITLEEGASIDVGHGGAGAQPSCANPPLPGSDNIGGAAGGGGGGYGALGGSGGAGNANGGVKSTGGAGGPSIAVPAGPRGGCPGAHGGDGISPGGIGGLGGQGGGALYFVAADRIELGKLAALTAGGGGGHGGGQSGTGSTATGNAGGGGGGSGGMIFLEAPHVLGGQARVAANGGGGGEGSEVALGGHDGDAGTTSMIGAPGGTNGAPRGADGGRGGSRDAAPGETVTALLDGGGGGGGGGVGYVHIVSADVQLGSVSPAAN